MLKSFTFKIRFLLNSTVIKLKNFINSNQKSSRVTFWVFACAYQILLKIQQFDDVIGSHDNEKEISDNESSSSPKQALIIDEEDSSMRPQILISAANDDVLNTDHVSLDENSFLEAQEDCSASVEPDAGNMDEAPAM